MSGKTGIMEVNGSLWLPSIMSSTDVERTTKIYIFGMLDARNQGHRLALYKNDNTRGLAENSLLHNFSNASTHGFESIRTQALC